MPVYQTDAQFYTSMQMLFERIRSQTPNPIDQLSMSKLLVRMNFSDPKATIIVNGRKTPVGIQYGGAASTLLPDLDAQMSTDTLHQILNDTLSLQEALAGRKMKVGGMLWKAASLGAILDHGRLLYGGVLKDQGLQ